MAKQDERIQVGASLVAPNADAQLLDSEHLWDNSPLRPPIEGVHDETGKLVASLLGFNPIDIVQARSNTEDWGSPLDLRKEEAARLLGEPREFSTEAAAALSRTAVSQRDPTETRTTSATSLHSMDNAIGAAVLHARTFSDFDGATALSYLADLEPALALERALEIATNKSLKDFRRESALRIAAGLDSQATLELTQSMKAGPDAGLAALIEDVMEESGEFREVGEARSNAFNKIVKERSEVIQTLLGLSDIDPQIALEKLRDPNSERAARICCLAVGTESPNPEVRLESLRLLDVEEHFLARALAWNMQTDRNQNVRDFACALNQA